MLVFTLRRRLKGAHHLVDLLAGSYQRNARDYQSLLCFLSALLVLRRYIVLHENLLGFGLNKIIQLHDDGNLILLPSLYSQIS
jgi:hypothetical protein